MNKLFSVLALFAVFCPLALADEGSTASDPLDRLAEQLGAPEFADRQQASQKLSEAGRSAFPALEKAAETGTREVASRAVEILRAHYERGDDETKGVAKAALERLAKCGNASAAQRANEVINPPPPPQQLPIFGGINALPIRVGNAQIQIGAIRGLGGVGKRITMRDNNGDKEIEVEEGDKKTKIKAPAQGNIEVEITEKVNGKETTRKIEAKDLDDLKKKDADAAKIYEQYSQRGNAIQINAGGAGPVANPDTLKQGIKSIDSLIERYKAQLPGNPNMQGTIDALERSKQRMKDMLPAEKPAEATPPK